LPVSVAIVELVVFVMVAERVGFGWAILLQMATSLVGLIVLRFEGFRAWARVRHGGGDPTGDRIGTARGPDPTKIADTGVRLLAGVLLTIPGFVTDLVALALLIPPIRRSTGRRLSAAVFRTFPSQETRPGPKGPTSRPQHRPVVIEGEIVDDDGRHHS
jgi:UPF0716 protein FxsA